MQAGIQLQKFQSMNVRYCTKGVLRTAFCAVLATGVILFVYEKNLSKMISFRGSWISNGTRPNDHLRGNDLDSILRSIRLCTQNERLDHMKSVCRRRYEVSKSSVMTPSESSLVDYKHNVTLCWMSKAAGTSLKAFILEAYGLNLSNHQKEEDSIEFVHLPKTLTEYKLPELYQFNETMAWSIVESYLNVMAIRHPFDRLVAYYRDKILDTDRESNHPNRAAKILKEFRQEVFLQNTNLSKMRWPQKVIGLPTFKELMTWIYRHKVMDKHWNFIYETCHPCAHDWRAILRVETMDIDGRLLAKMVKSKHSGIPIRHSHEKKANHSIFYKRLDQFAEIPEEIVDYFIDFYRTDMEMFGYRWDKRTNTAYCAIKTADGWCC